MRKEAVYTVLLNVLLFKGMRCSITADPRYIRFSVLEDGVATHYNLRVSASPIIVAFFFSSTISTNSLRSCSIYIVLKSRPSPFSATFVPPRPSNAPFMVSMSYTLTCYPMSTTADLFYVA